VTLTSDLLTLKVVSESRVPILVFLGLSVLDLGPMYSTDVRRQAATLSSRIFSMSTGGCGGEGPWSSTLADKGSAANKHTSLSYYVRLRSVFRVQD